MAQSLYIVSALGAVAVLLMMPRRGPSASAYGVVLGAATLAGFWLYLAPQIPGGPSPLMAYYYIFSALAIGSAVRVITHTRPVYAALWFVMTLLASSGLVLLLGAEFMAFAIIIIYGGAILVTYVFVIMLAAQAGDPTDAEHSPIYDRQAREPAAAVAAGFLLLAVLLDIMFPTTPWEPNPAVEDPSDGALVRELLNDRPAAHLAAEGVPGAAETAAEARVTNAERVGLDLFQSHPLGLELAGLILLVSLIGAVVIARQRVAQEEDEANQSERAAPPGAG